MATWKKVVVSGSAVSQLNNDSGYLISGQSGEVILSGSFSGSFQGDGSGLTGISADTLANSIVDGNGIADFSFNGSAGATVTVQNDGSTLSVGANGVKVADAGITATQLNASVAGDGLAGGAGTALSVNTDGTTITTSGDNLTLAGTTFSSSVDSRIDTAQAQATANSASLAALDTDFATDAELNALSASAHTARASVASDADSANTTLSSSFATTIGNLDSIYATDASVSAVASTASADTSALSASAHTARASVASDADSANTTLSSSFATTIGNLGNTYATDTELSNVSSSLDAAKQDNISVSDTSGQGGIDLTFSANDISGQTVGLGASDNVQFADILATGDVTVQGDLTVQGTTTSINTTNLDVEDKFILLNSGSANPDEGGIVIDEGSGTGHAFLLDSSSTRFGFKASLDSTTTGDVTPEAFVSAVVDVPAGHSDIAEYQKNGNIKVLSDGDIFIYS
jgi:hypothetical protein